jgi:hypothetical protein
LWQVVHICRDKLLKPGTTVYPTIDLGREFRVDHPNIERSDSGN